MIDPKKPQGEERFYNAIHELMKIGDRINDRLLWVIALLVLLLLATFFRR